MQAMLLHATIAVVFTGIYFTEMVAAGDDDSIDIFLPSVDLSGDDSYVCLPYVLPADESLYITDFEPKADMSVSHHMLLYGCEVPGDSSGNPYSCSQMTHDLGEAKPTCAEGTSIIYAWALGAAGFELPDDTSFKIGAGTKIKTLVLQMHFRNRGLYQGGSGLQMKVQSTPTRNISGILLLGRDEASIQAKSVENLDVLCPYSGLTIHPFAYRVHTHTLGVVVSGYRIRDDTWTEIGRKNPQLPQMFNPLSEYIADIKEGDILAARCVMDNEGNRSVGIGDTKNDEMCDFYIMYSVANDAIGQRALSDRRPECESVDENSQGWKVIDSKFPPESNIIPDEDKVAMASGMHMHGNHDHMDMMMMNHLQEREVDENAELDEKELRDLLGGEEEME